MNNNIKNIGVFVINLEKCSSRLEQISNNLNKQNINFTRISATDGNDINVDELDSTDISPEFKKFVINNPSLIGHLGCSMSHTKAIKEFQNSNYDYCIILEDDAIIPENFLNKVKKYINESNKSYWDLLLLGYFCDDDSLCLENKLYDYNISSNIRHIGYYYGAHAYVLNKKTINKVVKTLQPFIWTIDHQFAGLNKKKKLTINSVYPPIVLVPGNNSIKHWGFSKKINWDNYKTTTNSTARNQC